MKGPFPRRSKFNAKRTTSGGVTYDSKMEAKYAEQLEWRKRAGEIIKIERQWQVPIMVNGWLVCKFIVDFKLTFPDGREEFHEVKGHPTEAFKLKWKLAKALFPERTWVLVKKGLNQPKIA